MNYSTHQLNSDEKKFIIIFLCDFLFGAGCSSSERSDHSIAGFDSANINPSSTHVQFDEAETGTIGINDSISDHIHLLSDSVFSLLPQTQSTDYQLTKLSLLPPKTQTIHQFLVFFRSKNYQIT